MTTPIHKITQLYKGLAHSLLVRHIEMKESSFECTPTLPEGLSKEKKEMFMTLAKFAFDTGSPTGDSTLLVHQFLHSAPQNAISKSRKITFFKEDIPEGLVHFGFMNESTEM